MVGPDPFGGQLAVALMQALQRQAVQEGPNRSVMFGGPGPSQNYIDQTRLNHAAQQDSAAANRVLQVADSLFKADGAQGFLDDLGKLLEKHKDSPFVSAIFDGMDPKLVAEGRAKHEAALQASNMVGLEMNLPDAFSSGYNEGLSSFMRGDTAVANPQSNGGYSPIMDATQQQMDQRDATLQARTQKTTSRVEAKRTQREQSRLPEIKARARSEANKKLIDNTVGNTAANFLGRLLAKFHGGAG